MDDIRPPGSVEVGCSHPKCDIAWWIDPLDPRLPDGPFYCGGTHEDKRERQIESLWPLFGFQWGSWGVRGLRSDGKPSLGCCSYGGEPAGTVTFHDKWWVKRGSFDYEDITTLNDPLSIPPRIDWECRSTHLWNFERPDEEPLPRMGGTVYVSQPEGGTKPMRLVLHKCIDCGRICHLHEDHPKAFSGPASCSEEPCHYTTPCGVRNGHAHKLDGYLQELHGPDVEWTMWESLNEDTADTVEKYDRGIVLVRQFRTPEKPLFALIEYEHPNTLPVLVEKIRWSRLDQVVLSKKGSWHVQQMYRRIKTAIPFVI